MKLVVDGNGMITAYCMVGDIPGSVEYEGTIPDDFEINFESSFYMLKDGEIVPNPDYVPPTDDTSNGEGASATQNVLKAIAGQLADHCDGLSEHSDRITKLEDTIEQIQTKLGGD